MKTKQRIRDDSSVEAFLLERYRALHVRLVAVQISNRVFSLLAIAFLVLIDSLLRNRLIIVLYAAIFFTTFWFLEQRTLSLQLRGLEETLARHTGGEWEDFYIKSTYFTSEQKLWSRLFRLEPVMWLLLIFTVTFMRFF